MPKGTILRFYTLHWTCLTCSHALWFISSLHALNKTELFFLTCLIKQSTTDSDQTIIGSGPSEEPWWYLCSINDFLWHWFVSKTQKNLMKLSNCSVSQKVLLCVVNQVLLSTGKVTCRSSSQQNAPAIKQNHCSQTQPPLTHRLSGF